MPPWDCGDGWWGKEICLHGIVEMGGGVRRCALLDGEDEGMLEGECEGL